MPGHVFRRGDDGVALCTYEEEDVAFFRDNRSDRGVRRLLRNVDPVNAHAVAEEREEHSTDDDSAKFVVTKDGEAAGSISLWAGDAANGTAWMGAWVDPAFHGDGVATEAASLVVDYAFEERRLNKVQTGVFEPNGPSNRVMEKLGFEREVVRRKDVLIDGERYDAYHYGMLREEWEGKP